MYWFVGSVVWILLAVVVIVIGMQRFRRPKCPSCGLSVDRDLSSCPYCGASL